MSAIRTTLLMGALTGLFLGLGYFFFGTQGMFWFLILAGVMNFISYWFSDKIVLAIYHAKEISRTQDPKLHSMVERLSKEFGIPKPKIYHIPMSASNAFATGRSPKHAAIAVTAGIVEMLNEDELEGVIAHELGHVKNRDTLTSTIAATIAGAISYFGYALMFGNDEDRNPLAALAVMILAPLGAALIQMGISRTREFAADRSGAHVSKKPMALASALEKLEKGAEYKPMKGNPSTAHMFIVNPFKGEGLANMFSTHPKTALRVARLKEIEKELRKR